MIKCPNCNAELNFDPKEQKITCEYCKTTFNPNSTEIKLNSSEEVNTYEGKSYICSSCGAKLLTFDETAVTFCSFCGSQAMIESKMMQINNPNYIIPFKKTKEECIKSYKKIVSKSLFAPSYLKSDIVVNKFRGIYIPYCVYKLSHDGVISNMGKRYSHRSGDYVYYNDYKITSNLKALYEGMSFDLVSNYYDRFSQAIPYNFQEIEKFNPNYLSGFYADCSDVNNDIYVNDAKKISEYDVGKRLYKIKEYQKYGCMNPKVNFSSIDKKTAMYPVYFLATRTKDNTHVNYAVINGQTGEAVADIPIDFKKYIICSLIVSIPIFLIINWNLVITPKYVCGFSIFIAIICLIIAFSQIKKIDNRENHDDDLGYKKTFNQKKKTYTKTFKYIYKLLLAIIIGVSVLVLNFVHDYFYYGSSIITFILIFLSFRDLVKLHNKLVSSKLPQLQKRGGDEND